MISKKINKDIIVLCGGRGASRFIPALLRRFRHVTLLVNAYDDGKSTGRIRTHLGVLGPSDIAKNIVTLAATHHGPDSPIVNFLSYRLPTGSRIGELEELLKQVLSKQGTCRKQAQKHTLIELFARLPNAINCPFREYILAFLDHVALAGQKKNQTFDFRDLALRNVILVGAYYVHGKSYNRATAAIQRMLNVESEIIVSSERTGFLIAILENGDVLRSEAEISDFTHKVQVYRVHIVERPLSDSEIRCITAYANPELASRFIETRWPYNNVPSEAALRCLKRADVIIYSPGTFYSSLIPTIIDVGDTIQALNVPKILIANLEQAGCLSVTKAITEIYSYGVGHVPRITANSLHSQAISKFVSHVVIDSKRHEQATQNKLNDTLCVLQADIEDRNAPGQHARETLGQMLVEIVEGKYL